MSNNNSEDGNDGGDNVNDNTSDDDNTGGGNTNVDDRFY